jgi:hydroxymethylpyrimidine/phosphomethylpyrimidine kinase
MNPPRVLVFAGLDPSGRAGLLADGEAIRKMGAQPILCATAIAAQSETRLLRIAPIPVADLLAQAECALEDGRVAAVKLGMLGTRATLEAILALLRGPLTGSAAVVDPVFSTSRGGALYEGDPKDYLELAAQVDLVTPNLAEAELLTGITCRDEEAMGRAARALIDQGARAVLVKGGHLPGAPADLLVSRSGQKWLRGGRVQHDKRGTGCRLASAIAAGLALGRPLEASVERAVELVRGYLAS